MKSFLLLLCLPLTTAFAQSQSNSSGIASGKNTTVKERTAMETFISQIGSTNKFVTVSNIWQTDANFDKTALLTKVEDAQPLVIDYANVATLIGKNTTAISLVVPGIGGTIYTIDLGQYSNFSNDFGVYENRNGVETKIDYTPGKYYKGTVHGIPGSMAAFSFFNNEVFGIFSIPGVGNMVLVPNTMVGKYYDNQHYLLYNDKDLKIKDQAPGCATDKLPEMFTDHSANRTTTTLNNKVYNNCKEIRVYEMADYSMYVSEGSNSTNVTNYLTSVFNNEAIIYANEGIPVILSHLAINTASDAYQGLVIGTATSTDYLNLFGDQIQNTFRTTWNCDMAMLASTRDGSLGGVAWLQALCQNYAGASSHFGSYAYSNIDVSTLRTFPTYSWDVEVMTHETGHVVGSPHTHRCCWNPSGTGTTAIDGCYTIEGSCAIPTPALPAGGGTIMSYCHLTSAGINFTNGFGQQPGDTIRTYIKNRTTCGIQYNPSIALATTNRTVTANKECTDLTTGITYYWNDHNTADQADDTLVLMIKKGANNIGNLNTAGFTVTANTIVRYGTGTGDTITFPTGTSPSILAQSYSMRRYWKITPTAVPATAVEVIFPFLSTDTVDVHGSVVGLAPMSSYLMYKANSPIDPNPLNNFPGAATTDFQIYTYGATASTTNWSLSTVGSTQLAHMQMTNLAGGGSGFYTYCTKHPAPTLGALPTPPCPGTSATYSVTADASATSYVWTVTGSGWSGSSTTGSITLTAGSVVGTITVKANDSCGTGNPTTFNITPSPFPTETIAATSSLCSTASTVDFAVTPVSGTTYSWTVLGTGWSLNTVSGSTMTANTGIGTGTIIVNGNNFCGTGPNDTFLAVMSSLPPVAPTSITPPALACPSSVGIFTTPAVPGATSYTWTVAGTGWSGFSTSNSITVNIGTGTGTLSASASNGCGTSPVYSHAETTSTGPGAATSISAPTAPCSGTNVTLTTPSIPSATSYNWTIAGTGWSGSSSTNSINVTVGTGTATVTVTPSNTCGAGGSFTTTIAPSPAPTSTFALSSHIVNINTNIIAFYTGSAPAGSVFTWNFPGGVGTPGTGSGAQTVSYSTPGQYIIFLTVNNGTGCSSASADTVDVINPAGVNTLNVQKVSADIIPNPNNGAFDILFTTPVNKAVSVKLYDMQARVVYNREFTDTSSKKLSIEAGNLPPGTYTATILIDGSFISKKITIVK